MLRVRNSQTTRFGVAAAFLLLASTSSHAAPITYEYTGSWTSFSSAPFGPTYVASITFDNGGTTVANQVFDQSDFVSATVTSGAYDVTITPAEISGWSVNFSSNGLGQLGAGWFNASPAGGGSWHFDTWFPDANFSAPNGGSAGYFSSNLSNPGTLANVPEPTSLAAFGLIALGAGGYSRLRRGKPATTA